MRKNRKTQAYKLRQISGRIKAVLQIISYNNATKMSPNILRCLQKIKLFGGHPEAKNVPEVSLKCPQKITALKRGNEAKKFHQSFTDFSPKKYHQTTTEIPPKNREGKAKLRTRNKGKNVNITYHYLILPKQFVYVLC